MLQGFDRSPHIDAVIETRGEEIAVGIERAVAFIASNTRGGANLRAVYTCGGGARIPGLTEALAARLRIEAHQANPLLALTVRDGAMDLSQPGWRTPALPITSAREGSMIEINLLPAPTVENGAVRWWRPPSIISPRWPAISRGQGQYPPLRAHGAVIVGASFLFRRTDAKIRFSRSEEGTRHSARYAVVLQDRRALRLG